MDSSGDPPVVHGAWPCRLAILTTLLIAGCVAPLVFSLSLGPTGSFRTGLMTLGLSCCSAEGAGEERPVTQKRFRDVRIERLDLTQRTPVPDTVAEISVITAHGQTATFSAAIVDCLYDVSIVATGMVDAREYRWEGPLHCLVVEPADEAVTFRWAVWAVGGQPRNPRLYTDKQNHSYFCWRQYSSLAIMGVARPRPVRDALVADFAWGFARPDAVFSAYDDAPAGAWNRRSWGLWAPIDLVSLGLAEGVWDLTVRNPVTGFEYHAQSTDGFEWTQAGNP